MFDHGLEYLKKKLPGFEDKPSPQPAVQTAVAPQPKPQPPPQNPTNPPPAEMLDSLTSFLRQYLVCDQYQLNVIALWIVHTWCYQHFPTTAYLNICSAEPESGKTRCLELLNLLSNSPWLATGVLKGTIIDKLLTPERCTENLGAPHTVLLDDCHHTFGPSERQPLIALLNTGSQKTGRYILGPDEYCLFGPKAFASNVPLLPSLASRCITISLKRKKQSEPVRRFDRNAAEAQAAILLAWLNTIGSNPGWLAKKANETPPGIPKRLTPHEQDCAEPLIHIAGAIGGHWPEKARTAIDIIFQNAEGTTRTELLCDLRVIFFNKNDPEYLATKDLLTELALRDHRPWSSWGGKSGKKLAGMLKPLGIFRTEFHPAEGDHFRGYLFKSFQDAWERYIPPVPADFGRTTGPGAAK